VKNKEFEVKKFAKALDIVLTNDQVHCPSALPTPHTRTVL
jgi:hypothetical protein